MRKTEKYRVFNNSGQSIILSWRCSQSRPYVWCVTKQSLCLKIENWNSSFKSSYRTLYAYHRSKN